MASWLSFFCRLLFRLKKKKEKRSKGLQKEGLLPLENWVCAEGDNTQWTTNAAAGLLGLDLCLHDGIAIGRSKSGITIVCYRMSQLFWPSHPSPLVDAHRSRSLSNFCAEVFRPKIGAGEGITALDTK